MKTEDRIRAGLKVREQSPSKKTHIFEIEPRDPNNISSDIVKKELYHHGYRVVKSVGEGAYAKVKLAEVMASKIARNEALAELAENTSDVTVGSYYSNVSLQLHVILFILTCNMGLGYVHMHLCCISTDEHSLHHHVLCCMST